VLTRQNYFEAGQLVQFALRPRMRVGADSEYGRLVRTFTDNTSFRELVTGILDGMDLLVVSASELGLILTSRRESVFAYRYSDESSNWTKDNVRLLRGLAHIGIAAWAFPHPDDLRDSAVRFVDVRDVDEFLHRCCATLSERADAIARQQELNSDADGVAGDGLVDLALAAGLGAAWPEWQRMPPGVVGTTGRGASRIAKSSSTYWVLRAFSELEHAGMVRRQGSDVDGRYQVLERFRVQVGRSASEEAYRVLSALRQSDLAVADSDPRTPGPVRPLPGRPPQWADAGEHTVSVAVSADSEERS
jgi:hypothetical protein